MPKLINLLALTLTATVTAQTTVSPERMQAIYDEVKTPFKYGVVIPEESGRWVDCPTVFRHDGRWYLMHVRLEPPPMKGYTTQMEVSADLVNWTSVGTILARGAEGAWDHGNAGAGIALYDPEWAGRAELQTFRNRYWLSYIGGAAYGYEVTPLSIGMASTVDPSRPVLWDKLPAPVLRPGDSDARSGEAITLYKSYIFHDPANTLGAPYVMFYNAKGNAERIFTAVSTNMTQWVRHGTNAVIDNGARISGDPQVVRMGDVWVMFYFGYGWRPGGAFNTFAASYDLVNWTKWSGASLAKPSEPFDSTHAHKPWLVKDNGVVYQFYCAVGNQGRVIALATSQAIIPNFGFETPVTTNFITAPTNASWAFTGSAGVALNAGTLTVGNAAAPEGKQVGFLRDDGSISKTLSGFATGTACKLTFQAAQCQNNHQSGQTFNVLVNGTAISSFTPAQDNPGYTLASVSFTATTSTNVISFVGTGSGGNTVFLDDIRITTPLASRQGR